VNCDDGLRLKNVYIAAAARCAPPDNKPLPSELLNCRGYFGTRDRYLAAQSRARAGENWLGRFSGNPETPRERFRRAWDTSSRTVRKWIFQKLGCGCLAFTTRANKIRRRDADSGDVCEGAAARTAISRAGTKTQHRAHGEHRGHRGHREEKDHANAETRRALELRGEVCRDFTAVLAAGADRRWLGSTGLCSGHVVYRINSRT